MSDERTPQYADDEVEYAKLATIPTGHYPATCLGIEDYTLEDYGPRWRWHFLIAGAHPEGGDFRLTVLTPPRVSETGIANVLAAALGQQYAAGQRFSRAAVRDRPVQLYVVLDEAKGRNKVKGAAPLAAQAPAPAQAPSSATGNADMQAAVQQQLAQLEQAKAELEKVKAEAAKAAAQASDAASDPSALPPAPTQAPVDAP